MNLFSKSISIGATLLLLVTPASTLAAPATGSARLDTRLAALHTRCDTETDKRIASLTDAQNRVNNLKKLTNDQKEKFVSQIQTDIQGITSLKAKCDADTDLTTLQADTKSIFTAYRVYAVFLPQTHLLAASDTMDVTADELNDLASKLQTRIQAQGSPVNLTSLLSDMQSKIKDAQSQYSLVESQVTPLTPDSFNTDPTGTKAVLEKARSEIKTGATDLRAAFSDAKQIRDALKTQNTASSSGTQQ